jgi:hypothetical protein
MTLCLCVHFDAHPTHPIGGTSDFDDNTPSQLASMSSSSLWMLHEVEMHLMTHFLDTQSIIAFAQCNRRILARCRDPFAWKHAPSIRLHVDRLPDWSSTSIPHSLLQHCSLSLLVARGSNPLPLQRANWPLPVHELHMEMGSPFSHMRPSRIVPNPELAWALVVASLPQLRVLRYPSTVIPMMLSHIIQMQSLHTLLLFVHVSATDFTELVSIPSLTSLTLWVASSLPAGRLPRLPRLRSLRLRNTSLLFMTLSCLEAMQLTNLEALTLENPHTLTHAGDRVQPDFKKWIGRMSNLKVIRMERAQACSMLLQALALAVLPASLERVEVMLQPRWPQFSSQLDPFMEIPSQDSISQLLKVAPSVQIVLQAPRTLDAWLLESKGEIISMQDDSFWTEFGADTARAQWQRIQTSFFAGVRSRVLLETRTSLQIRGPTHDEYL